MAAAESQPRALSSSADRMPRDLSPSSNAAPQFKEQESVELAARLELAMLGLACFVVAGLPGKPGFCTGFFFDQILRDFIH